METKHHDRNKPTRWINTESLASVRLAPVLCHWRRNFLSVLCLLTYLPLF